MFFLAAIFHPQCNQVANLSAEFLHFFKGPMCFTSIGQPVQWCFHIAKVWYHFLLVNHPPTQHDILAIDNSGPLC